jgi:hypothetical protein
MRSLRTLGHHRGAVQREGAPAWRRAATRHPNVPRGSHVDLEAPVASGGVSAIGTLRDHSAPIKRSETQIRMSKLLRHAARLSMIRMLSISASGVPANDARCRPRRRRLGNDAAARICEIRDAGGCAGLLRSPRFGMKRRLACWLLLLAPVAGRAQEQEPSPPQEARASPSKRKTPPRFDTPFPGRLALELGLGRLRLSIGPAIFRQGGRGPPREW